MLLAYTVRNVYGRILPQDMPYPSPRLSFLLRIHSTETKV